jgi:hypothetical protein
MSPTRLLQLSTEQLCSLRDTCTQGGGGRPIERLLALVVVGLAIGMPVLLVLSGPSPLAPFR